MLRVKIGKVVFDFTILNAVLAVQSDFQDYSLVIIEFAQTQLIEALADLEI